MNGRYRQVSRDPIHGMLIDGRTGAPKRFERGRICANCPTILAPDNGDTLCSPCGELVSGMPIVTIDPADEDDTVTETLANICASPLRQKLEKQNRKAS